MFKSKPKPKTPIVPKWKDCYDMAYDRPFGYGHYTCPPPRLSDAEIKRRAESLAQQEAYQDSRARAREALLEIAESLEFEPCDRIRAAELLLTTSNPSPVVI